MPGRAPSRCSLCKERGHNRVRCPHDLATATSIREAYEARERASFQHTRAMLLSTTPVRHPPEVVALQQELRDGQAYWRAEVRAEVTEMQQRLRELTLAPRESLSEPRGPTARERMVQEILFENAEMLPDGLYKNLMDALVIRD